MRLLLGSLLVWHDVGGKNSLLCLLAFQLESREWTDDLVIDSSRGPHRVILTGTDARIFIAAVHAGIHGIIITLHVLFHLLRAVLSITTSNLMHVSRVYRCQHTLLELYTSADIIAMLAVIMGVTISGRPSRIYKSTRCVNRVKLHVC